jgi:hypothetical protein
MMLHPGGPLTVKDVLESLAAEVGGNPARFNQGSLNSDPTAHRCDPGGDIPGLVVHRHTPPFAEYRVLDKTAPAVES